jgi:hypothetical protein
MATVAATIIMSQTYFVQANGQCRWWRPNSITTRTTVTKPVEPIAAGGDKLPIWVTKTSDLPPLELKLSSNNSWVAREASIRSRGALSTDSLVLNLSRAGSAPEGPNNNKKGVCRKMIMWPVGTVILRYATTTSMSALLTVRTVNIIIVNTDGYIVLDIILGVVRIDIVLLTSNQNASLVE